MGRHQPGPGLPLQGGHRRFEAGQGDAAEGENWESEWQPQVSLFRFVWLDIDWVGW